MTLSIKSSTYGIIMLSSIMLSVLMLNVIMLSIALGQMHKLTMKCVHFMHITNL